MHDTIRYFALYVMYNVVCLATWQHVAHQKRFQSSVEAKVAFLEWPHVGLLCARIHVLQFRSSFHLKFSEVGKYFGLNVIFYCSLVSLFKPYIIRFPTGQIFCYVQV